MLHIFVLWNMTFLSQVWWHAPLIPHWGGRGRGNVPSSWPAWSTQWALWQLELLSESCLKQANKKWFLSHICLFSEVLEIATRALPLSGRFPPTESHLQNTLMCSYASIWNKAKRSQLTYFSPHESIHLRWGWLKTICSAIFKCIIHNY